MRWTLALTLRQNASEQLAASATAGSFQEAIVAEPSVASLFRQEDVPLPPGSSRTVAGRFWIGAAGSVRPDVNCFTEGVTWESCCHSRHGPGGNAQCWGTDSTGSGRVFTWDLCCGHRYSLTFEGFWRSSNELRASTASNSCSVLGPEGQELCRWALSRTAVARHTRRTAQRLQAEAAQSCTGRAERPKTSRGSIPVLGFPVAFDTKKLSLRALQSIDFPVDRLVLIASGNSTHLPQLVAAARRIRPDLEVVESLPSRNLGCAGGWNSVVATAPSAKWWLISSHDVAFPPGALARIAARMADEEEADAVLACKLLSSGKPAPDMENRPLFLRSFGQLGAKIETKWFLPKGDAPGVQVKHNNLVAFVLTRAAVANAGLFDENYWPAYAEDWDYLERVFHFGGRWDVDFSIQLIHGPEMKQEPLSETVAPSDAVQYSGTWSFAAPTVPSGSENVSSRSSSDGQVPKDPEPSTERATLLEQLQAAGNYVYLKQKFGVLRFGDWSQGSFDYAGAGPFGHGRSWNDWVLDPTRLACIQDVHTFNQLRASLGLPASLQCGYDTRLLQGEDQES
ncbi:unnamed protein product [Polarella glacialis]|uniref:Uncharacterized protein n=1 Tax=Polarella glacialis TaxID=89957 RepID=A0A813DRR9_POLGL|nr:unnamed protein product [Polarella glacialis]